MPKGIVAILLLVSFFFSTPLFAASTREGFLEGPYLTLSGGVIQFDWDINQRTGVEHGFEYEPLLALGFGWNVFDWLAPELQLLYTTDSNNGRREHIGGVHVGLVFTWIAKPLNNFKKWRLLPFVKPGVSVQIAGLPADVLSNQDTVILKGIGPSLSGGIRFTYKEYLYLGLEVQEELISQEGKSQNLSPGGNTLIYKGGWKPQFEVFTMVGVHY